MTTFIKKSKMNKKGLKDAAVARHKIKNVTMHRCKVNPIVEYA